MPNVSSRLMLALVLPSLAACAPDALAPTAANLTHARFEPAPLPSVILVRRGSAGGALEIPIPDKAPPDTGAVPVSSSPARGSVVTGLKESF